MKIYGNTKADSCPVCGCKDFCNLWKIPFSDVTKGNLGKIPLRKVPLLNSEDLYCYSQCAICDTIFLDPCSSSYWDNRDNDHHVKKAIARTGWPSYTQRVYKLLNVPIIKYDTVIDVAAGGCQCLTVMKELEIPWKHMIATDIRTSTIEYAEKLGFEAYLHDICKDGPLITKGSITYVIFAEAFEHVQSPLVAMQNIAKMLAVDGYTFFTATSTEGCLPIRPGENIMTNLKAIMMLLKQCNLHLVWKEFASQRWLIIAQKLK